MLFRERVEVRQLEHQVSDSECALSSSATASRKNPNSGSMTRAAVQQHVPDDAACLRGQHAGVTGGQGEPVRSLGLRLHAHGIERTPLRRRQSSREYRDEALRFAEASQSAKRALRITGGRVDQQPRERRGDSRRQRRSAPAAKTRSSPRRRTSAASAGAPAYG